FTRSYGLETYFHKGIVHDSKSTEAYVENMLRYNFFYNDAAFFHETWKICEKKALKQKFMELDNFITSLKSPYEIRDASKKLAVRFLKVVESFQSVRRCKTYMEAIQAGEAHVHYAMT